MARVEVAAQPWGTLTTKTGRVAVGGLCTINTVVYATSDPDGLTEVAPAQFFTDGQGRLPGYVEEGTYTFVDPDGDVLTVEAVSGDTVASLVADLGVDVRGLFDTLSTRVGAVEAGQSNIIDQIAAKAPLTHTHADIDVPGLEARVTALEASDPPPGGGTTVTWADPLDLETVEGVINHVASDTASVTTSGTVPASIVFFHGTTQLNTDNTGPPWSLIFDTTAVVDDDYVLTAKAYDGADGTGVLLDSTSITVTVDNPAPAFASVRGCSASPTGSLGQFNLSDNDYIMAYRFVLDEEVTADRWYCPLILSGSSIGGREGYASGNGGTIQPKIVEVDPVTGLPDMGTVLASEADVNGVARHNAAIAEFTSLTSPGVESLLWYFDFAEGDVTFDPDTMYAVTVQNTAANPGNGGFTFGGGTGVNGNHCSVDTNWFSLTDAGPNGENTLDTTDAVHAIGGLDPRETTIWSDDNGSTWNFGDEVGWYSVGNGSMKMWHGHGYRTSTGTNIGHGVPGLFGAGSGVATVRWNDCPRDALLVQAGGFGAATAGALGTVTVTNLRTGQFGTASSVNSGAQGGILNNPVAVLTGDDVTITATGAVERADAISFYEVYGIGSRLPYNYTVLSGYPSTNKDMISLFFKDDDDLHPWYA